VNLESADEAGDTPETTDEAPSIDETEKIKPKYSPKKSAKAQKKVKPNYSTKQSK
jgi:hypothetical protein